MDDTSVASQKQDTPAGQTPPSPGSGNAQVKMVPESDLIAVKKGSEKAVADTVTSYEAKAVELKGLYDVEHQKVLLGETRITELEGQVNTNSGAAGQASELQTQLAAAKAENEAAKVNLTEYQKNAIASRYGISVDTLKDKTPEQLGHLEEALKIVGAKSGGGYDTGGGGSSAASLTPVDACAAEIEAIRAKAK